MNSKMEILEWKTCRKCGIPKEPDDYQECKSSYYSKTLGKTIEYTKKRHICRSCMSAAAYEKRVIKQQKEKKVYKTKDLSKIQGARATVINHLRNGSWISVIQDVGTFEVERLLTNGENDFLVVYPNTLNWLQKYQVVQEIPIPQRSTLLIEQKFILAKEYESKHNPISENCSTVRTKVNSERNGQRV